MGLSPRGKVSTESGVIYVDGNFDYKIAGIGLNGVELSLNPVLTEYKVQDLNKNPFLSDYSDNSFDLITCQLSIDYLTKPITVLQECLRVLRPGGCIAITFSNRLFFTKAISSWSGQSDLEHIYQVGQYLYYADYLKSNEVESKNRIKKQDYILEQPPKAINISPKSSGGDPLYAVLAYKTFN